MRTLGVALVAAALLGASACSKQREPAGSTEVRGAPYGGAPGRAQGMRGGPHGMRGPAACAIGDGPLTPEVRAAVERALSDERRAEAQYAALEAEHGSATPYRRIVTAERHHASELERLLTAHGHEVPPAAAPPPAPSAANAKAACAFGVTSERDNVALYEELLERPLPADVRCVFERLRDASADRHLPAFERCVSRW